MYGLVLLFLRFIFILQKMTREVIAMSANADRLLLLIHHFLMCSYRVAECIKIAAIIHSPRPDKKSFRILRNCPKSRIELSLNLNLKKSRKM